MGDWLKANPTFSMDDYLWKISVPLAKILAHDMTYIKYLSEKQAKQQSVIKTAQRVDDPMQLLNDFGTPIFNKDDK